MILFKYEILTGLNGLESVLLVHLVEIERNIIKFNFFFYYFSLVKDWK